MNPIGDRVLERCRHLGAEDAELYISRGTEFTVRIYKGEIESLISAESRGVGLRTFLEHRVGFSYTSDTEPEALDGLVEEALLNGRYNHADEANVLPQTEPADPVAGLASPSLGQIDPAALGFANALLLPGQTIDNVLLPASERTVTRWFNTNAFNRVSAQQLASNVQTLSSAFSGIRAPHVNNFDISAIKNTQIRERMRLQFNAEFINAFNHPQFTPPNTTPTSTAFGQLTGSYNWQRIIEFGLKVMF